ncbi:MAG: bifunctional UDP-4-keto-pentose/UDP-xylose synthase [Nitrospirales bacterium]|nr:bifunctional UDP-4-keto-pentose/UDP-xylose synthase [Nitrospira sp.]MDR4502668.1 bifunctional UDP-4-keto-pentose/UDP-xylose synthase [Nitrospirales bacterium]
MKVLSLGGAGFIGSHLTERLLLEGHSVVVVDYYDDKISELINHPGLTLINQDIREPNWGLEELVSDADVVIDLIAYANPGLYVKMPLEVFELNFTENLKIAKACRKLQRRLIQFSTCEVYGKTVASFLNGHLVNPDDPIHATFSEDHTNFILGPIGKHRWIYASAKQLLERILHAYGIENGFNYSIIRPFNFIGPKIDYLLNETDGIPRVFSFFMDALINGGQMKLVDGGTHRRCYTYIDDAIEAIYAIVLNPNDVCDRQIFNIGSPKNEISIQELAVSMRDLYANEFSDKPSKLPEIVTVSSEEFYGVGYEDSDRRIPDISKAKVLLGWEPKWDIHNTLRATMSYYVKEYHMHYALKPWKHDLMQKALSVKD